MNRGGLIGAALAAVLVLTACGGGGDGASSSAPAGDPRPGGTLVWQLPTEVSTNINPLTSADPSALGVVSGTVYSKLVEFRTGPDVKGLEVVPDLATSWEISPDGLTYTFRLRDGVRWQDVAPVNGRPLTADDVVATFTAIKQRGLQAWMFERVTSIGAPDPRTVVFRLDRPFAPLLDYLAYHTSMVVPREGIEGRYDLDTTAIGTGPFVLAGHTPDVEWVLRRNPGYFVPGRPYLEEIRRPVITDTAAMTSALRSGRLDVGTTSDVNVAEEFRGDDDYTVTETPGAPISVYLNPARKPFDDLRVRRAVAMAVDWQGMGENIRGRFNLTSILRPDTSAAALTPDDVRRLRPFDPDRARTLLAEAGFPNGIDTSMMVQKIDDEDVREAQWIQADLADVGIRMQIEIVDAGTGISRRRSHDFAMAKALRGVHLPDQMWRDFAPTSSENYASVRDRQLDTWFAESRSTTDTAVQADRYRRMQERMETDIVQALYPIQKFDYGMSGPRVQGLYPSPIYQGRRLADVWLSDPR